MDRLSLSFIQPALVLLRCQLFFFPLCVHMYGTTMSLVGDTYLKQRMVPQILGDTPFGEMKYASRKGVAMQEAPLALHFVTYTPSTCMKC